MSLGKAGAESELTPVFGLTKGNLWPIVEEATGCSVTSFDVRIAHPPPAICGFQAEKAIPTFAYVTTSGDAGEVVVFAKRFYRTGPAESRQYEFLLAHDAPIPRKYGSLMSEDREILFIEHVQPCAISTMREMLSLMARLHAIRPSVEYAAWLEAAPWVFRDRLAGAGPALDAIWDHAGRGDLGEDLLVLHSSAGPTGLRQLHTSVEQTLARCWRMPRGLIHTDFSRENTGLRMTGEPVVMDLEWVSMGPRFFDVAGLLGRSPDRWPPDENGIERARHYLDEYRRFGGSAPSLDKLLEEIRILWLAGHLRFLRWNLDRALGGWDTSPADEDERHACCKHLHWLLTMLLDQSP